MGNSAACAAREIVAELQDANHEAVFVGGGVRDLILKRHPKDFDVATSATPDKLKKLFPDSLLVGAKFGVILVRRRKFNVEVATFREEGDYNDRRRPDLVRFSSIEKDALRRDFTSNALYYDPVSDKLIDLVGGLRDIEHRVLRTVGDAKVRFEEDALRVLRGVRFAANLDFQVEEMTWTALCGAVPNLESISVERKRDELVRGFTGENPARFFDLLDQAGILSQLLPEVVYLKGCQQPPEFHPEGDVFTHTRLLLEHMKSEPSVELAMAVLLHDIGKPATQTFEDRIRFNGHDKVGAAMAEDICRRLRFSNLQADSICKMVKRHMQFVNVPEMKLSTLNRFLSSPEIEDELELHRLDCLASHGNLETYNYARDKLMEFRVNESFKGNLPKPIVTGRDLIRWGFTPGPVFSRLLQELMDAQIEGRITTKEEGRKRSLSFIEDSKSRKG